MVDRSDPSEDPPQFVLGVDPDWLQRQFEALASRLDSFEATIEAAASVPISKGPSTERAFYSPVEFAELVGRSEYTVREWCRLERIHAEKCDTGRGDSKAWKIPASELARYQDHGLLPLRYLR